MPGKAAVVLTAAALSVTVGVLIGIVLIIGDKARQPAVGSAPSSTATEPTGPTGPTEASAPLVSGADATARISVLPAASSADITTGSTPWTSPTPAPTSTPPASSTASTRRSTTPTRPTPTVSSSAIRATTTRTGIVFTTVTVAPPTSTSVAATTSTTTTTTTSTSSTSGPPASTTRATTSPAPVGAPSAGRACAALGDKATAPGGVTVFCQHDFRNGSLAWRAVVDGGGCLSKKMTGTGADGRAYVCRPDRKGLDHWRRA